MSNKVKQSKDLTWNNCKTYTDVLYMMRKFITGEIRGYPGYYFSEEEKMRPTIDDADDKKYMDYLLKLNDIGCLTHNGHAYKFIPDENFTFTNGEYNNEKVYGTLVQREYIDFYYKLKQNQNIEDICNKMKNNGMYYNICDYTKKVCHKHYDITDDEHAVTQVISKTNQKYIFTRSYLGDDYDELYDELPVLNWIGKNNWSPEYETFVKHSSRTDDSIFSSYLLSFAVIEDSWEKKDEYLIERIFNILESN